MRNIILKFVVHGRGTVGVGSGSEFIQWARYIGGRVIGESRLQGLVD